MIRSELRSRSTSFAPQVNQSRLDHTRMVAYDKSMWTLAQSKMSFMTKYTKMDTIMGQSKWYHERDTRDWEEKAPGVQPTPLRNQGYRRRLLTTKVYHDGAVMDIDDTVESIANYFRDVNVERAHSLARLIDKKILEGFLDELVHEGTAAPVTDFTGGSAVTPETQRSPQPTAAQMAQRRVTATGYQKAYRDIFFVKAQAADITSQQNIFAGEDIEDIRKVFSKRHLNGQLCMTLTPNLRTLLRKDSQFVDAENMYANKSAANAGFSDGFSYRGVKFVDVKEDQLPGLQNSQSGTKAATAGANFTISCRTLDNDDSRMLRGRYIDSANRSKLASLKGNVTGETAPSADVVTQKTTFATGEKRHVVVTKAVDVAYVWCTSPIGNPLIFAKRPTLSMQAVERLQEWSLAKMNYARRSFGVLLRDEDYVMAVPVAASNVDVA